MVNTSDSPQTSFDDLKNEGQEISSENAEIQKEELNTQTDPVCETDEQPEVKNQKELQIEPDPGSPDNARELSEIKDLLIDLSKHFESKLKYDKHKDAIIDKLHAENQSYKNDLLKKTVMPFVNEIIYLIDAYSSLFKKHSETDDSEIDTVKLLKQFGGISEDLELLLNKNGIETFSVESEKVDFSKQKVIKTEPTCEQEKDKTVCERLKKGFMMDGKIIRQEWISCYKYDNENINKLKIEQNG